MGKCTAREGGKEGWSKKKCTWQFTSKILSWAVRTVLVLSELNLDQQVMCWAAALSTECTCRTSETWYQISHQTSCPFSKSVPRSIWELQCMYPYNPWQVCSLNCWHMSYSRYAGKLLSSMLLGFLLNSKHRLHCFCLTSNFKNLEICF